MGNRFSPLQLPGAAPGTALPHQCVVLRSDTLRGCEMQEFKGNWPWFGRGWPSSLFSAKQVIISHLNGAGVRDAPLRTTKAKPCHHPGVGRAQTDTEPVPRTFNHCSAAFPGSDRCRRWVITGPWLSLCPHFTHATTGHTAVRPCETPAPLLVLPLLWVPASIAVPFPPRVPPHHSGC